MGDAERPKQANSKCFPLLFNCSAEKSSLPRFVHILPEKAFFVNDCVPKRCCPHIVFSGVKIFLASLKHEFSKRRYDPVTVLWHCPPVPHLPLLFVLLLLFQADPSCHRPKEQEGGLFLPDAARQEPKGQQQQVGVLRASSASLLHIFQTQNTLH